MALPSSWSLISLWVSQVSTPVGSRPKEGSHSSSLPSLDNSDTESVSSEGGTYSDANTPTSIQAPMSYLSSSGPSIHGSTPTVSEINGQSSAHEFLESNIAFADILSDLTDQGTHSVFQNLDINGPHASNYGSQEAFQGFVNQLSFHVGSTVASSSIATWYWDNFSDQNSVISCDSNASGVTNITVPDPISAINDHYGMGTLARFGAYSSNTHIHRPVPSDAQRMAGQTTASKITCSARRHNFRPAPYSLFEAQNGRHSRKEDRKSHDSLQLSHKSGSKSPGVKATRFGLLKRVCQICRICSREFQTQKEAERHWQVHDVRTEYSSYEQAESSNTAERRDTVELQKLLKADTATSDTGDSRKLSPNRQTLMLSKLPAMATTAATNNVLPSDVEIVDRKGKGRADRTAADISVNSEATCHRDEDCLSDNHGSRELDFQSQANSSGASSDFYGHYYSIGLSLEFVLPSDWVYIGGAMGDSGSRSTQKRGLADDQENA